MHAATVLGRPVHSSCRYPVDNGHQTAIFRQRRWFAEKMISSCVEGRTSTEIARWESRASVGEPLLNALNNYTPVNAVVKCLA